MWVFSIIVNVISSYLILAVFNFCETGCSAYKVGDILKTGPRSLKLILGDCKTLYATIILCMDFTLVIFNFTFHVQYVNACLSRESNSKRYASSLSSCRPTVYHTKMGIPLGAFPNGRISKLAGLCSTLFL